MRPTLPLQSYLIVALPLAVIYGLLSWHDQAALDQAFPPFSTLCLAILATVAYFANIRLICSINGEDFELFE